MKRMAHRVVLSMGLAAIIGIGFPFAAEGVALPPGILASPDVFSIAPAGTVLTSISPAQAFSLPGNDQGTLLTAVVEDVAGGTLDFLYQWTAAPANRNEFIAASAINFGGFVTDVGYIGSGAALPPSLTSLGFTPGTPTAFPSSVFRSLSGDAIDWFFSTPSLFLPGNTSPILEIKTNASSWTEGVAGIQSGGAANLLAFAPSTTAAVPEPFSAIVWFLLTASGALGVRVWRGRRGPRADESDSALPAGHRSWSPENRAAIRAIIDRGMRR